MNKAIFVGNITKDLELKQTQTGKSLLRFSIAVNEGFNDRKITTFIDCTAWEKTAELINRFCAKGSKVLLEGKMRTDSYEKDGKKYSSMYLLVDNVEFLTRNEQNQQITRNDPQNEKDVVIDEEELPFY